MTNKNTSYSYFTIFACFYLLSQLIIIINDIYKAQTSPTQQMRQVNRCTITVILEQEHFQSFPEHRQWNVQQTEIGWKTVPHDWPVNGKTAVSVVCPRTWNSELTGLSRAQVTPTAVWWRWLAVCRQVWRSHAMPTFVVLNILHQYPEQLCCSMVVMFLITLL